jgi:hypothetical protein
VLHSIYSVLPPELGQSLPLFHTMSFDQQIAELFRTALSRTVSRPENPSTIEILTAHLENNLRFLGMLSMSKIKRPLGEDTKFRALLFEQMKEMKALISSLGSAPRIPSLFEETQAEENLKRFFELAERKTKESPVRELFVIFAGRSETNQMMANRIKYLDHFRLNAEKQEKSIHELTAKIASENKRKVGLEAKIGEIIECAEADFWTRVETLLNLFNKSRATTDNGSIEFRSLKKDLEAMEQNTRSEIKVQERKYKTTIHFLKKDNDCLRLELERMRIQLEGL